MKKGTAFGRWLPSARIVTFAINSKNARVKKRNKRETEKGIQWTCAKVREREGERWCKICGRALTRPQTFGANRMGTGMGTYLRYTAKGKVYETRINDIRQCRRLFCVLSHIHRHARAREYVYACVQCKRANGRKRKHGESLESEKGGLKENYAQRGWKLRKKVSV